jgi:FAD/FMN-containing dehydrogenase
MASLVDQLSEVVGGAHVLTEADMVAPYCRDWTGRWGGPAAGVVRPASTAEVGAVLETCRRNGTPIVVQGGNTGLVGGGVPASATAERPGRPPLILSTTRMRGLEPVDTTCWQVTAGAGVTLAAVQEAAGASGLAFGVDLAARGSATIGGMVATNAGGIHVLRYGAMRQQVVGVEAVLGDGRVVSRLDGLLKDNSGYDLSQLMVGSEGTLGIITAARLRLLPASPERAVALLGVASTAEAVRALAELREMTEGLDAAEIFYQDGLDLVCRHFHLPPPLNTAFPVYLLVECAGRVRVADALVDALGVMGVDEHSTAIGVEPSSAARLWAYRELHTDAVASLGVPHKLDVSVRVDMLAELEQAVRRSVRRVAPEATLVMWGHVGDGNLHVNVIGPPAGDDTVDVAVLELAVSLGGSISAEHGIGRAKLAQLALVRSDDERSAMRSIKRALDPAGVLNPGVLLPA